MPAMGLRRIRTGGQSDAGKGGLLSAASLWRQSATLTRPYRLPGSRALTDPRSFIIMPGPARRSRAFRTVPVPRPAANAHDIHMPQNRRQRNAATEQVPLAHVAYTTQ